MAARRHKLRRFGHWRVGWACAGSLEHEPFPLVRGRLFLPTVCHDLLNYLSRDLLVFTRNGQRSHVFNPSAFGLAIAAFILLITQRPDLTTGADIAQTLGHPEHPYLWIFLMGFVVQAFKVTTVTMSAAITMYLLGITYTWAFGGYYYIDTAIPIAVFLGMNLLITDPASSPKKLTGRILFGVLYGLLVFLSYDLLREFEQSTGDYSLNISWMDKLLCVPLLNLLARPIDRLVGVAESHLSEIRWIESNRLHLGIWAIAFCSLLPSLREHPGKNAQFWENSCDGGIRRACLDKNRLYRSKCDSGNPDACFNYASNFDHGSNVPKRANVALDGYRQACVGELKLGCLGVAKICSEVRRLCDTKELVAALERACVLGSEIGCRELVKAVSKTPESPLHLSEIIESLERGCTLQASHACEGLHTAAVEQLRPTAKKDFKLARYLFKVACANGHESSCLNLSIMEIKGDGGAKKISSAKTRLAIWCKRESAQACAMLERLSRQQD